MIEIVYPSEFFNNNYDACTGCSCKVEPPPYRETLANSEDYNDPVP
ncbi:MAG: hypothetical protein GF317_09930 [Candidatus Lokiarchaeota archaeon]|nr:hypothetical protein [Candidatus Lokiarchaeota archaeon]